MKNDLFNTEIDEIIRASMKLADEPDPELNNKLKATLYQKETAMRKQPATRGFSLWYLPMILNLVTFIMLAGVALIVISNRSLYFSETMKYNEVNDKLEVVEIKRMEFRNLLNAQNRDELRQWLLENYNKEPECWVVVKRGRPIDDETFWYIDAVEEAMCFGWIDSTTKKMDNGVTAQRLAPRRKGSLWSELNKERCRRMERLGRMTDAGRAVLPDMSEKGFVIDKDILNALQADAEVWENFQSFPPLYQRVRIDTIQIKKKQPELFQSRLQKLLDNTKAGVMYGEWNDNGRLLTE